MCLSIEDLTHVNRIPLSSETLYPIYNIPISLSPPSLRTETRAPVALCSQRCQTQRRKAMWTLFHSQWCGSHKTTRAMKWAFNFELMMMMMQWRDNIVKDRDDYANRSINRFSSFSFRFPFNKTWRMITI